MERSLEKIIFLLEQITPTTIKIICSIGLILNLLSAIVLSRPQMRNSHLNILLLGLTSADAFYLVCSIVRWSEFLRELDRYRIIRTFFYWFAQTSSIYLTLAISIERLVVIYWPFRARALFTISTSKWILAFDFSFGVVMGGPEFVYQWTESGGSYRNFYVNYWTWIFLIIRLPIPFLSLLILNTLIYIKLRKLAKERATMRNEDPTATAEENSITKMLVCVVAVFGICYSFLFPAVLFYYWWQYSPSGSEVKQSYYKIWLVSFYLSNITACLNSSANLVIYIAMGMKFRQEFYRIVSRLFKCRKSQPEIVELGAVRTS